MNESPLLVFPITEANWYNENVRTEGMTLRDHFATESLGLCFAQYLNHAEENGFSDGWRDGVASDAYKMADAMLKARGE
ncbi:hypothetical protein EYY98_10685 [Obesumbacterium proteus]|nr:hypothetical protein EYY98_10685 [Obesumbacterium proteus]